ncbi:MAG: PHA/PHB synthase family protein [Acidimicrobiales bacterium]
MRMSEAITSETVSGRIEAAAEAIGPEADFFARHDPTSFGRALAQAGAAVATNPLEAWTAAVRFAGRLTEAACATVARFGGHETPVTLAPEPRDRRFVDPAWQSHPWFFAHRQAYLAWAHYVHELLTVGDAEAPEAAKAAFALGMIVDALAPTNFLPTNPVALRKAVETGGASVVQGLRNFLDDLLTNDGRPRQVDRSVLEVGRDLAVTPGKVVFRNELMELIQYEPQTRTVLEIPLLLSPPFINKYYVMDLSPGRSFVEWAVQHGHTVFAISYRNPDESMRDVTLDDYVIEGPRQALDVVRQITGAAQVNVVGLCVGGTMTAMLLAYLAESDPGLVRSATLLNTLVDFTDPGILGVFTDEASILGLERRMAGPGFMEPSQMADTFNALRGNDLIWNYVAANWLMGETPPAFDILAWNADGTRMPAGMYSFYLRSCYAENRLARGTMTVAGKRLCPGEITADAYIVGALEDHIVPWTSSYATTRVLNSSLRFVLTSSGHVAGIVNPPSPKRRYWTNDELPETAEEWRSGATAHTGSWWEDWSAWIKPRAGRRRPPPATGSPEHPALDDAPGSYVHG